MLCPTPATQLGCERSRRAEASTRQPSRTYHTGTAPAGMGRCQPRARDRRGKTAASCSNSTAILGKRHLNPASLEGNSCQHGKACPSTPLLCSGAKKNMCCENRRCDSHTWELSFAQPSSPQGALPAAQPIPPWDPRLSSPAWCFQRVWPHRRLSFRSLQPFKNLTPL